MVPKVYWGLSTLDLLDPCVILFISDCGLIIQEPTAAGADQLPGQDPGITFD